MMELKNKLKELRMAHHMTQEAVGDALGVSSQTVSKWERGLLSPDIALLPRIALLFQCSIDSLFSMERTWSPEHRRTLNAKIRELHEKGDWEGVYQTWLHEIEWHPEHYPYYLNVMFIVFRKKLYDREHVGKVLSLAEHAEKYCTNEDIRNEIYRVMLQLCSESKDPAVREKGKYYYQKLPSLRHSREVYATFVMEGEEYRSQVLKNLIYTVDLAECSVRQLILPEMKPREQLFYYQKAAALLETVLDGKYAGLYDPPLFFDYYSIAKLYVQLGEHRKAANYVQKILSGIDRYLRAGAQEPVSKLLYTTSVPDGVPPELRLQALLRRMAKNAKMEAFRKDIVATQQRLEAYLAQKGTEK